MSGFNPNYADFVDYAQFLRQLLDKMKIMEKEITDLKAENRDLKESFDAQRRDTEDLIKDIERQELINESLSAMGILEKVL